MRCFLGFHDWTGWHNFEDYSTHLSRDCRRCGKEQRPQEKGQGMRCYFNLHKWSQWGNWSDEVKLRVCQLCCKRDVMLSEDHPYFQSQEQAKECTPRVGEDGWIMVHHRAPNGSDLCFGPFMSYEEMVQWQLRVGDEHQVVGVAHPVYKTVDWSR